MTGTRKKRGAPRRAKRKPGPGRAKIIPPDWQRRAYSLEPKVIHALEIRAVLERVPVSILVNRILKAAVRGGGQ